MSMEVFLRVRHPTSSENEVGKETLLTYDEKNTSLILKEKETYKVGKGNGRAR